MAGAGLPSITEGTGLVLELKAAFHSLGTKQGKQSLLPVMTLQLFDFIAQCVAQFLGETTNPDTDSEQCLPLGFVFPFTCRQTQLNKVRGRALSQAMTTAQQHWGEEPS